MPRPRLVVYHLVCAHKNTALAAKTLQSLCAEPVKNFAAGAVFRWAQTRVCVLLPEKLRVMPPMDAKADITSPCGKHVFVVTRAIEPREIRCGW